MRGERGSTWLDLLGSPSLWGARGAEALLGALSLPDTGTSSPSMDLEVAEAGFASVAALGAVCAVKAPIRTRRHPQQTDRRRFADAVKS